MRSDRLATTALAHLSNVGQVHRMQRKDRRAENMHVFAYLAFAWDLRVPNKLGHSLGGRSFVCIQGVNYAIMPCYIITLSPCCVVHVITNNSVCSLFNENLFARSFVRANIHIRCGHDPCSGAGGWAWAGEAMAYALARLSFKRLSGAPYNCYRARECTAHKLQHNHEMLRPFRYWLSCASLELECIRARTITQKRRLHKYHANDRVSVSRDYTDRFTLLSCVSTSTSVWIFLVCCAEWAESTVWRWCIDTFDIQCNGDTCKAHVAFSYTPFS